MRYVKARHLRVGEHIATSGQVSSFGTIGRALVIQNEPLPHENGEASWRALLLRAEQGHDWQLTMLADAPVLLAPDEEIRG